MSEVNRELSATIARVIEELEEQRKDLELLVHFFAREKGTFNRLIKQYFGIWLLKSRLGQTLVILPEDERRYLEEVLGLSREFEYYEEQLDYAIRRHGEIITVDQMVSLIKRIDTLVIQLKLHLNQYNSGATEVLPKIKGILRRKVGPLLFGIALIAANIRLSSLPTVIGGAYIIYNVTVLDKQ